jgi:hypothetical protein
VSLDSLFEMRNRRVTTEEHRGVVWTEVREPGIRTQWNPIAGHVRDPGLITGAIVIVKDKILDIDRFGTKDALGLAPAHRDANAMILHFVTPTSLAASTLLSRTELTGQFFPGRPKFIVPTLTDPAPATPWTVPPLIVN